MLLSTRSSSKAEAARHSPGQTVVISNSFWKSHGKPAFNKKAEEAKDANGAKEANEAKEAKEAKEAREANEPGGAKGARDCYVLPLDKGPH